MKKFMVAVSLGLLLFSCKPGKKIPDVSGIKVDVEVQRFDKALFAIDTANVEASLNKLQEQYPSFLNDYLYNILMAPPFPDSVIQKVKLFTRDYGSLYKAVQQKFPDFNEAGEVKRGLQFVKHYFPSYKVPAKIITFIGPLEGYGNVLTADGLAVGLQLYMGKDFPVYQTDFISNVYPAYRSRRFEPQYIAANCMRNIIDDMFAYNPAGKPLVEQMIESGKRLYLLDQLLPESADSVKTGYTQQQLDGCYAHEAAIWNFFLKNNLLYESDPFLIRDYINDGPKTTELGEGAPGNIGQFVGWQVVKKWMEKNDKKTLPELMQTPARQIFNEAKYKPK
ncbi:gliding motility lipoprotein GldB [Foetidibacter luteolus]|uniref:gliding motility lipoprotein GldB n=1 Tax=Foetidibacter luteolus TaxID=2608880 RepID=UPI001F2A5DE1|nr:hypothetical protein [Foetidibacter luteolus]